MNKQFTNEELYILSDALLNLIRTTNEALKLTYDNKSIEALRNVNEIYRKLNNKVCSMMK